MRVLVTNDDGIESGGVHALARALTGHGEVTVFVPSRDYSGAGASIGHLGHGIPDVHMVDRPELAGVAAAYHFDGPPALAALLACQGIFGDPPDVVYSGINLGWNVGHSIHFSGTVGACITARVFDIPALAVSQPAAGAGDPQYWDTAAEVAAGFLTDLVAEPRLLNVNVPNLPPGDLRGTRRATLANRIPFALHSPTLSETEPGRFRAEFESGGHFDSAEGTDTALVDAGYVAVTELAETTVAANSTVEGRPGR